MKFLLAQSTIALLVLLTLGACGSTESNDSLETFPSVPYVTAESDQGILAVAVRTAPTQPPSRGMLSARFDVTGRDGKPRDGLDVEVVPWMPSMGHGSSMDPVVTAEGDGKYHVDNLSLPMAGRWELRTTFGGAESDQIVIQLDVR